MKMEIEKGWNYQMVPRNENAACFSIKTDTPNLITKKLYGVGLGAQGASNLFLILPLPDINEE